MLVQDFQINLLEDQLRLIAAGKVQRWDVVKWTTTVNLALATASVGIGKVVAGVIICVFVVGVAAAGHYLVDHYNTRMTGARGGSDKVEAYLRDAGINLSGIIPAANERTNRPLERYDEESYLPSTTSSGSA